MSYQDPRDPRTARYESGYTPESRAYSSQNDPYARDPYAADPYAGQAGYNQGGYEQGRPAKPRRGPDINPVTFAGGDCGACVVAIVLDVLGTDCAPAALTAMTR